MPRKLQWWFLSRVEHECLQKFCQNFFRNGPIFLQIVILSQKLANLPGTLQQGPLGCTRLWIVVEQQKTHFFYFENFFRNGPIFLQIDILSQKLAKSMVPTQCAHLGCHRIWILLEHQEAPIFCLRNFFWNGPTSLQIEFFSKI